MNLNKIFLDMKNYCVIRFPKEFPNVKGDIDILSLDYNYQKEYLKKKAPKNYKVKIKNGSRNNLHVDYYENNNFIIKFDISNSLNDLYPEFDIPNSLTQSIIKNSFKNNFGVYVPRIEDELSIRWLEYEKYKKERPDKIKHLHFIENHKNIKFIKYSQLANQ